MDAKLKAQYKGELAQPAKRISAKRGETKTIELVFKNTGKTTWYDIARQTKLPEGHQAIVLHKSDGQSKNFQIKIGDSEEKTDRKFKGALDSTGNKKTNFHVVEPGESVIVTAQITVKKFTLQGDYSLYFRLGFKNGETSPGFAEAIVPVHIESSDNYGYAQNLRQLFQLSFMNPGAVSYKTTNEAFDSKNALSIPVIMCTWNRIDNLQKTITMLREQNINVEFHIWNNNASARKQIDTLVSNETSLPISVSHSKHNIGGFGRFYEARKLADQHPFVIFIDDDQEFEKNAMKSFSKEGKKKTIVSQWAYSFDTTQNYWDKKEVQDQNETVHYCGTGGMIIDSSIFKTEELFKCPKQFWFIEDLWLSYIASKRFNWKLQKAKTDFVMLDDQKNQMYGLVDKKDAFLKYLVNERKWGLSRVSS